MSLRNTEKEFTYHKEDQFGNQPEHYWKKYESIPIINNDDTVILYALGNGACVKELDLVQKVGGLNSLVTSRKKDLFKGHSNHG